MTSRSAPAPRLVIDGGKSKTDARIVDDTGRETARATGPGLAIIETPGGLELVTASLRETVARLGPVRDFHTVCIGLNGVLRAGPVATARTVKALRAVTAAGRYIVTSDVVTSFVGALGVRPGVVVAAGTGSVILALDAEGEAFPVDGSGPLFADRGSGYDIGRQGLDSALRVADGMAGSRMIHDRAVEQFGGISEVISEVYASENPTRIIASFSRGVAAAAAQGDPDALAMWERAANDLAEGAVAAARAAGLLTGPFDVATTGGLFTVGPLLREPFARALARRAPLARLREADGPALDGGTTIALSPAPILTGVSTWIDLDSEA
jgi:N-acetylglucosamine kinase-like BadF-type ATPase